MSDKPDDVTSINEQANEAFNGKDIPANKKPEEAKDTQGANEAANAQFNGEGEDDVLGNRVGGLRGSSD
jgi:hypothetical protein